MKRFLVPVVAFAMGLLVSPYINSTWLMQWLQSSTLYSSVVTTGTAPGDFDLAHTLGPFVAVNKDPVTYKSAVGKWNCDSRKDPVCLEVDHVLPESPLQPGDTCTISQGQTLLLKGVAGNRVLVEYVTNRDHADRYRCPWGTKFFMKRSDYNRFMPTKAAASQYVRGISNGRWSNL